MKKLDGTLSRWRHLKGGLAALALLLHGCASEPGSETAGDPGSPEEAERVALGPRDGFDLSATDLDRVQVGSPAPDFALRTLSGDTLVLSDFRGRKDVVLVFYRGHW